MIDLNDINHVIGRACKSGNKDLLKKILDEAKDNKINVDLEYGDGCFIIWAVDNGNNDIVNTLIYLCPPLKNYIS